MACHLDLKYKVSGNCSCLKGRSLDEVYIHVPFPVYPKAFVAKSLPTVFHEQQFTESAVCNVTEFRQIKNI